MMGHPHCKYGVHAPEAQGSLYAPEAQGSLPREQALLYARRTRTSLGRAVPYLSCTVWCTAGALLRICAQAGTVRDQGALPPPQPNPIPKPNPNQAHHLILIRTLTLTLIKVHYHHLNHSADHGGAQVNHACSQVISVSQIIMHQACTM